jgi:hypothetical protein
MAVLRGGRAREKAAGLERDVITTRAEPAAACSFRILSA